MSDDHDTVRDDATVTSDDMVKDGNAVEQAVQNVDQLRYAIDRGETAEKVDCPDPAAAPFGSDDGAAGFPPTRRNVEMAARHELRSPERSNSSAALRGAAVVIVALALGSALALVLRTRG